MKQNHTTHFHEFCICYWLKRLKQKHSEKLCLCNRLIILNTASFAFKTGSDQTLPQIALATGSPKYCHNVCLCNRLIQILPQILPLKQAHPNIATNFAYTTGSSKYCHKFCF